MSTRLSNGEKSDVEEALVKQLQNGVKFIDCPLSFDEQSEFWHKLFPEDFMGAVRVLAAHKSRVYGEFQSKDAAFHLQLDEKDYYTVLFRSNMDDSNFLVPTPLMRESFPKLAYNPSDGSLSHSAVSAPVLDSIQLAQHIGAEKALAVIDWVVTCDRMDADITDAKLVLADLFEMIKTAGQLKRMVPDLFQYIPLAQREAFDDQKRASTLPFAWAGYDRARIERMIGTLLKCQILSGLVKPRMEHAEHGNHNYNWAIKLRNARVRP